MDTTKKTPLPDDKNALKALVRKKDELVLAQQNTLDQKQSRIQFLEEQIILLKHGRFGKSSEKSSQQTELFDEVESNTDDDAIEIAEAVDSETPASTPKKKTSGRKPLPKSLPRVQVIHDLPDHEKICQCGCQKKCIGEDTSEQLDIVPAVVQVLVHTRKKYACESCETGVATAKLPPQPLPKTNASPGLLAYIATSKYQNGLPLYRMETLFKRLGIYLPRNTQANWMIKSSALLQPVFNLMNDSLLASGYIHMDETRVQVLKEPDKTAESLSYMWVRRTGDIEHPIVLFDYEPRRTGTTVKSLLGDYQGYLQTDDYAGYQKTGETAGITHLGCMAHARRKFIDAQKVTPSKKGKVSKSDMAVNMIKTLYAIES